MKNTMMEMRVRGFVGNALYDLGRWLGHKSFSVRNGSSEEVSLRFIFGDTLYGLSRWFELKSDRVRTPAGVFSDPRIIDTDAVTACGAPTTFFLDPKDPETREALIRGYSRATPT